MTDDRPAVEVRLQTLEDEHDALRNLPGQVVELSKSIERLWDMESRAEEREERRVTSLHDKIEKQGEKFEARFDRADKAHRDAAARAGADTSFIDRVKLLAGFVAVTVVPIVVAIIGTRGKG